MYSLGAKNKQKLFAESQIGDWGLTVLEAGFIFLERVL